MDSLPATPQWPRHPCTSSGRRQRPLQLQDNLSRSLRHTARIEPDIEPSGSQLAMNRLRPPDIQNARVIGPRIARTSSVRPLCRGGADRRTHSMMITSSKCRPQTAPAGFGSRYHRSRSWQRNSIQVPMHGSIDVRKVCGVLSGYEFTSPDPFGSADNTACSRRRDASGWKVR